MLKYDSAIIQKTIENFKKRDPSNPVTIMFDSDNTLYRFSTYGAVESSLREMYSRNFFKNLPIFPEAPTVIENLQRLGFKCGIITSCINSPFCANEKLESYAYHLPTIMPEDIIIVPEGVKKCDCFEDVSNIILIDDYYRNIMDWYNKGGIAIKKSYSGKVRPVPQVTSLIDLFVVLRELGAY